MTNAGREVQALLEDALLTLDELCGVAQLQQHWVIERVRGGLLCSFEHDEPARWRFDAVALRRARAMARLEREFDAVPELAALVVDLETEIARLRMRLNAAGLR